MDGPWLRFANTLRTGPVLNDKSAVSILSTHLVTFQSYFILDYERRTYIPYFQQSTLIVIPTS